MHPALEIDEILLNIFWYVRYGGGQGRIKVANRSLACLARTCRTFSEPALDMLWCSINGFRPLFQCLPDDLIGSFTEVSPPPFRFPSMIFKLKRRFRLSDWQIFCKYAARVVELFINPMHFENITSGLSFTFCCPPTPNLFPRLRKLTWHEWEEPAITHERVMFIKQFLGPSIVHLNLVLTDMFLESHSLDLFTILCMCTQVKKMEGDRWGDSEDVASAFSDAVCFWRNLEELTCTSLNDNALRHIASLKSFRQLEMNLPGYRTYSEPILAALGIPVFPRIQSFSFHSSPEDTLSAVADLVISLRPPQGRLSPAEFSASACSASETSFMDLGKSLPGTFNSDSLVDLTIVETAEPGFVINLSALCNLFSFVHLSVVHIRTQREVDLDDAALLQMAEAWPNLSSLSINEVDGWKKRSRATLRGLRVMLNKLPKLVELRVAIDGDSVLAGDIEMKSLGHFSICSVVI